MPVEPESNLHWKAFLYVSGELPPDDASDFERLLLEDQGAREAVASAVELVQVVSALGLEPTPRTLSISRSRRRRVLAWAGLAAAAGFLAASIAIPALRPTGKAEPDASQVALTWSGIRQGMDADWTALVAGSPTVETTDPTLAADAEPVVEPAVERPLPSWLLMAASPARSDSSQQEEN